MSPFSETLKKCGWLNEKGDLHPDIRPVGPITVRGDQVISGLTFSSNLNHVEKKVAFLSGVRYIDIETSSQCNRQCEYCSNSRYDRFSKNAFMSDDLYVSFIEQLADISFFGRIAFHGYNEPLMHVDHLLERLSFARKRLPDAILMIYTNGDYLTRDVFCRLEAAGLNSLNISVHSPKGSAYDEKYILGRVLNKSRELGLHAVMSNFTLNQEITFSLVGSSVSVAMRQQNYMINGHSRGDLLEGVGMKIPPREKPCILPFEWLAINYQGNVVPCCTLVGDAPDHQAYSIGDMNKESLLDIYCGERHLSWRRSLMVSSRKGAPCAACPVGVSIDFDAEWEQRLAVAIHIGAQL